VLLALDVGNTNVTIGAFSRADLVGRWRLRTIKEQTADEWGILLRNLFTLSSLDLASVDGVIISSVVPAVDQPLEAMAQRYFDRSPVFVNSASRLGITVHYDNPREVGADRLANAVAGFAKYGGPCIVVDLGTTINFDIVSRDGAFLGGVICPGIGMSISGLFAKTARLPMVDFREPEKLIGSNTVGSITSGLYYGFIGMIDGIVERVSAELGPDTKAVATGGQGERITHASRFVKLYDEDLTLEGLRLIWERSG
jgi:type III pantothenate kinase